MKRALPAFVCLLLITATSISAQGPAGAKPAGAETKAADKGKPMGGEETPVQPAGDSSKPKTEEKTAAQPELEVISEKKDAKGNASYHFQMGDTLTIQASGDLVKKIEDAMKAGGPTKGLTLLLDCEPITALPVTACRNPSGDGLEIRFHLVRDPNDDDNRHAWDRFLGKQKKHLMTPTVSLAIGSEAARPVPLKPPAIGSIDLTVASSARIRLAFWGCFLIFLVSFYLMIRNPSILRDSPSGYYSLGKAQMAFWGLLVVLAFAGVWIVIGTMEHIPPQALTLMGISAATGLGSVVIGASKDGAQPAAATDEPPPPKRQPSFYRDICDDGKGMSFHRLQVVLWTLVLGAVFVRQVGHTISMPEFPETLLILMGISSGTYLGFKTQEKP